jgi:hypothetical protein
MSHETWRKFVQRTRLYIGLDQIYLYLVFFGIRIAFYSQSMEGLYREFGIWLVYIPWNLPEWRAAPSWRLRHRYARKQEAFIA